MTQPSRGDIAWVSFPECKDVPDEEMDNPHMAVVLQNDGLNNRIGSTIVVPISSGTSDDRLTEIDLPAYSEDVDHDSKAIITKITCVSISRRIHDEGESEAAWKQGELTTDKMNEIENRLGYLLGV